MNGGKIMIRISGCTTAVTLFAALAIAVHLPILAQADGSSDSHKPKLLEFDAPGGTTETSAACAPSCGTFAYANNDRGVIVDFYTDPQVVPHAFLRTPEGRFTSFNVPGDGEGAGLNQGTVAYAGNDLGVIAGQFEDAQNIYHGFVREPDGKITPFDAPGAGKAANQGTLAWSLNLQGATAGVYIDGGSTEHGFVRSLDGMVTTIDPPGSIYTMVCEETCLNREGEIAGSYADSGGAYHGSYASQTVISLRSTLLERWGLRVPPASTTRVRSPGTFRTRRASFKASSVPAMASSVHSMLRAGGQAPARVRQFFRSTSSGQ
jgi:hypothetical protein